MRIYVADRETGTPIEEISSLMEGRKLIADFEQQDREDGTYSKDFYDIINDDGESVEKMTWYAVQETPDDDWSYGSYDYGDAVRMLRNQGFGMIAVVESDCYGDNCTGEIPYTEICNN